MSRAERAHPPSGELIALPGGVVVHAHVQGRAAGTAPDVILLHGASGNLRDFTLDLVGRLEDDFRVIAFDRPGLGHSPPLHGDGETLLEQATVLDEAATRLGVEQAVLVGHSFGGAVAMAWALDKPGKVSAVVSLGGATMPWPGELDAWYRIAASPIGSATVVPLVSALTPRSFAPRALKPIFAPQMPPDGYEEHIGVGLSLRAKTIRANTRQVFRLRPQLERMAKRYPDLTIPVEAVHGDTDSIVPVIIHSAPMVQLLPEGRLTVLPGVGHMPHHADPEAAVAAIKRAAQRAGLR